LSGDRNGADWLHRCPSPALALDPRGRIVAANAALARCLDATPADLAGRPLADWAKNPEALGRFLRGSGESAGEFVFRAGTTERWLHLALAKNAFADGDLVVATDTTPHHAAAQRFERERNQLLDIISAGSDWFWEHHASAPDVSRGTIRLFRTRREADHTVTVKHADRLWPDEVADQTYDPEGFEAWCRQQDRQEPYRDYVMRVLRDDGVEQFLRISAVPYSDENGVYQGYRGVSVDVTGQVLAERALRESEARLLRSEQHLRHAQRVIRIGSVEHELDTGVETWSDEMYRVLGIEPQTLPQSEARFINFVHPGDRQRVDRAIAIAKTGKTPRPGELRMLRRDGETRIIYIDTDLVAGAGGRAVMVGVFKDVTEQRQVEEQRRSMEHQLFHVQKLEALGTLAGGVAHEINNALVPVIAHTKIIAGKFPAESREHRSLGMALAGAERSRELVKQILAFSRKEEQRKESIDVAAVLRDALQLLRATVPSSISFVENIGAAPPVMGDANQLHQVIINLVNNAAQAIGEAHGTITLGLGAENDGASLRLSVADTGSGMNAATKARIFEPFFTTKEAGAGTGLGLSVVHGIVTQHGGKIAVDSEPGRGTRFDIVLPAAAPAALPKLRQAAS
jgi:PAS domain S-box-containing protein